MRKVGSETEIPPGSDMPVWRGELLALPSSLTGEVTVCVWDHVRPPWYSEAWHRGNSSAR